MNLKVRYKSVSRLAFRLLCLIEYLHDVYCSGKFLFEPVIDRDMDSLHNGRFELRGFISLN